MPEADDVWGEIQDAQDAVALRALSELMPELTEKYQLAPALRFAPPSVLMLCRTRAVKETDMQKTVQPE